MPQDNSLHTAIADNLRALGFDVVMVTFPVHDFKYRHVGQRLHNLYRKTFLKDRNFKQYLKYSLYQKKLLQTLDAIDGQADYALLIRPDIYPAKFLSEISKKVKLMVGYHWDGMANYPLVRTVVPYFDRFYVFNPADYPQREFPNLKPTTNFYLDNHFSPSAAAPSEVYYIGFMMKKRLPAIRIFTEWAQDRGLNVSINLLTKGTVPPAEKLPGVNYCSQCISYADNLEMMKNTKVMIDILDDSHQGLSLRTFEAVGFGKKLITTNQSIRYYDFYDENNILIWDGHTTDGLEAFIKTPYRPLEESLRLKYSFTNWIRNVLGEEPYQAIDFPAPLLQTATG